MSLAWPPLHSYNEIGAKAACAIAGALGANETLCFLRFDGNRPGFAGQSALLCAVRDKQQPERDLRVSMIDCSAGDARLIRAIDATSSFWIDADARQDDDVFDASDPYDEYDLDLSLPYDLWVAEQLLKVKLVHPTRSTVPVVTLALSFFAACDSRFLRSVSR